MTRFSSRQVRGYNLRNDLNAADFQDALQFLDGGSDHDLWVVRFAYARRDFGDSVFAGRAPGGLFKEAGVFQRERQAVCDRFEHGDLVLAPFAGGLGGADVQDADDLVLQADRHGDRESGIFSF